MTGRASGVAAAIMRGECRAIDVLADTRARIEAGDGAIHAFTDLTWVRAEREAEAVDAARRDNRALGPLAGVPYAVKNLFDVEGRTTVAGGWLNRNDPPARADAVLVDRMRAAGAILVGALNMDEHAYGFTTENTHYGATRNPHDHARIAGGSSGGSAAAVSAGFVPLTLGSDTNGSIRVPSSLCGVFGLKPTWGRLSRRGTYPFVHSLDHLGPFASSTDDLALAYDALQFADPQDPACAPRAIEPVGASSITVDGTRIAVLDGWFADWASEPARTAVALAAEALDAVDHVAFTMAEHARAAAFILTGAEGGALHRHRLATRYDAFEPLSRDRLVAGCLIPSSGVIQAQKVRRLALNEVRRLFERYDLLLAPATPVAAPPLGTETLDIAGRTVPARASLGLLAQPISCVGVPVCTVPLWPHADSHPDAGLPIGVQLIAAPWREDVCLAAARTLEAAGVATCRVPSAVSTLSR